MKKYIITITPVLKNEPLPSVVLDVSAAGVSVNYPKDADIKVNSLSDHSHSELCVKMPHDDKVFRLCYDAHRTQTDKKPAELNCI
jgi:hypothetical protein